MRTTRTLPAYVKAGLWALERLAPAAHKVVSVHPDVLLFMTLEDSDTSEEADEVRSNAEDVVERGLLWVGFRFRSKFVERENLDARLVFGPAGSLCIRDYSEGLLYAGI